MAEFVRTTHIAAQPRAVIDFALDTGNAPLISEDIVEMVRLDDGPLRPGARFRETRKVGGKPRVTEFELLAYDPDRGFAMQFDGGGFTISYAYSCAAARGGTDVTLKVEVTARGVKRVLAPVVRRVLEKMDGDSLERLRAAMGRRAA